MTDTPRGAQKVKKIARHRWSRINAALHRFLSGTRQETIDLERHIVRMLTAQRHPSWRQIKQMRYVFSNRETRLITVSLGVIVACVIWLLSSSLVRHRSVVAARGGSYIEGMVSIPHIFNPVLGAGNEAEADINRLIFSGLYRYNDRLELEPDLAATVTISEDQRQYLVTLRPNLTWQDGTPLTAKDVVFTYNSMANTAIASPLASTMQGVTVIAKDDQTVQFTVTKPYRFFPHVLTTGLLPEHIWSKVAAANWRGQDANRHPIGSGAWQFASADTTDNGNMRSLTLTPVTNSLRPAHLDQLTFKFYADRTSANDALRTQAIDGLVLLSGEDVAEARHISHLSFLPLDTTAVTSLFFNLGRSSPIGDIKVRQALRAAIDSHELLSNIEKQATPAIGPFPYPLPDHKAPAMGDPDQLLTAAGWPRQGAIRVNKNGQALDITLTVVDREPDRQVAEFIQNTWRKLGVETSLSFVAATDPSAVEQQIIRPRAYEILLFTTAYGAAIDPYSFWHSSQRQDPGLNLSSFSDKAADEALERLRRAPDEATTTTTLGDVARIIQEQVPAVFLYRPTFFYAVRDHVKGLNLGPIATPADRFNNVENWYVNTSGSWHW